MLSLILYKGEKKEYQSIHTLVCLKNINLEDPLIRSLKKFNIRKTRADAK